MEAAVLSPAVVMTEVDCNSNSVSAELEVKKLQELVRKLERQNEQLRHRAADPHRAPVSLRLPGPLHTLQCQASLRALTPPEPMIDYFHPHVAGDGAAAAGEVEKDAGGPSVLDELELLDLDSLCCSDESDETWLYTTSKTKELTDDNVVTPRQWCRQVLDRPKSEVEMARRSLSLRLEQARVEPTEQSVTDTDDDEEFVSRFRRQVEAQSRAQMVPRLEQDDRGVAFSTAEGRRKTSVSSVILRDCGSGHVTINGGDYMKHFSVLQDREQLMFPLQFVGMLGRFDLECTVSGGGRSGQAGALRLAISHALLAFLPEGDTEAMRQAGLLTPDPRLTERKKPGQEGARKKFTWKKR